MTGKLSRSIISQEKNNYSNFNRWDLLYQFGQFEKLEKDIKDVLNTTFNHGMLDANDPRGERLQAGLVLAATQIEKRYNLAAGTIQWWSGGVEFRTEEDERDLINDLQDVDQFINGDAMPSPVIEKFKSEARKGIKHNVPRYSQAQAHVEKVYIDEYDIAG